MVYVVVMCASCRSGLVADDDHRTTTCPRCGTRLELADLRVFHRGRDHAEAVRVAGAGNARSEGDLDAYLDACDGEEAPEPGSPLERALDRSRSRSGRKRTVAAVLALAEEVDVTRDRVVELLERLDADEDPDALLERLADRGDLFEPRSGVYRRLA